MRPFMATLALLLFAAPAYAADEAFCENYAAEATNVVQLSQKDVVFGLTLDFVGGQNPFGSFPRAVNGKTGCEFSGARWSDNYDVHKNWCLGQSEAAANAETAARDGDAKFCGVCFLYVAAALDAEANGRANRCPLSGPDWPSNPDDILQWCLRRNHDNLGTLIRRLQGDLSDAKDQINACEAARRPAKVTLPHAPSMRDKPKTPQDALSDTPCKWCKSKSNVRGATQQGGGNAMDNLGNNLNNGNLGAVSGSSGGAEAGRRATSPSTGQTNSAPSSAGAPSRSDSEPAVNSRIMNIPNPTFNAPR